MQRLVVVVAGIVTLVTFCACGTLLSTDFDEPIAQPDAAPPPPSPDAAVAPDPVAPDPIVEISAGSLVACARHGSGKVSCWGNNTFGAVGVSIAGSEKCGLSDCRPSPVTVQGLADVKQIVAGTGYACALRNDGKVLCWGDNANGILGVAKLDLAWTEMPKTIDDLPAAVEIAAGSSSVCARIEGAAAGVFCWGSNEYGLRGEPSAATTGPPARISGIDDAKALSLGGNGGTACVILPDDNVACWGNNSYGVAGHDATDTLCVNELPCSPTPTPITPKLSVAEVRAGAGHVCARRSDGRVLCWGANEWGQLGRATFDFDLHPEPDLVVNLAGATSLTSGVAQTCAFASNAIHCWGSNAFGELGSGFGGESCQSNAKCKSTPTPAALGIGAVTQVSTGTNFTLSLTGSGLYSWGANDFGQLGHAPGTSSDSERSCADERTCNPNPQPVVFR